jgi:hypothetical protein
LSKVKVLTQCLSGVDYRGRIPNRIDIDERPSIVDARTRIGDWELTWLLVKGQGFDPMFKWSESFIDGVICILCGFIGNG